MSKQWVSIKLLLLLIATAPAQAFEPLLPIPQQITYDEEKAALGKRLFFDPLLSSDQTIACASCHIPAYGGAEPRRFSVGVGNQQGIMNAPTVFNSSFNFRQFWNGRAADLVEQVAGPLHNPIEMALPADQVVERLNNHAEYPRLFEQIYERKEVRFSDVTEVIAEFEKALITPDSRFDQFLRGEIELEPDEMGGYRQFKMLGCVSCHNGINIGGNSYQYLGAVNPLDKPVEGGDVFARTGNPFDRNRFKVPSLRNIELTAPYLHDGSQSTLNDVLKVMAFHNLGFDLTEEESRLLIAFLRTLTGKPPAILGQP